MVILISNSFCTSIVLLQTCSFRGISDCTVIHDTLVNAGAYREKARRILPIQIQRVFWGACYDNIDGGIEILIPDCQPDLDDFDIAPVLDSFRADKDLIADLNYWVGQNALFVEIWQGQIVIGDKLIADIDTQMMQRK